ncbi:MAG: mismatch repair protein MutS2 [Chloroflexota bacterium]|nr:mismatch repair protein MutS2 [Chloroflexota bacterium]
MDAKSIALLEFPAVRERLAGLTGFPPGRRLAEALEPSDDPVVVARGLEETDQTRDLLAEHSAVGVGSAHDIGPSIERAVRGGRLDPAQFLEIVETLDAVARLGTSLAEERRPLLRALGRDLHALPALRSTLGRSFDPVGELLDSASPRLGGLRAAVRVAYDRLRRRLEALVQAETASGALQESLITLRNGRYVVPVKADARSRVKGIVHDASGSGQTLFVEPLVAVELGNAWREAQAAEREEIERILDELSALVAANAAALREALGALARFDLWAAKARLAAEMDGIRAETADRAEVVLLGARHPGLSGRVVPIDLRLGDGYTALVVTGPNTGGKTVTLRTLGLLALMHQAGLHVPAQAGSRLPVFRDVFADIGDEQSVAQSLSTFSGHLRSITRIVEAAGAGALVLLDELGAGTDPTEGSALAQALLDHFIRAGSLVAATTHYAELKAYAHTTPSARNASVEFDLETLSPTYHLSIGLPGGSQAFAIAERLGLPGAIVADARSRLTETQRTFEATLASLKATEDETGDALERAREADARAAEALRLAQEERRAARRERDAVVATARSEAERVVEELREEVRGVRRALERETVTAKSLASAVADAEGLLAGLSDADAPAPAASPVEPRPWQLGDRARSRSQGWEGRIAALERGGKRVTLDAGSLRVTVDATDLEAVVGTEPVTPPEETLAAIWPSERTAMTTGRRRGGRERSPAASPAARGARGTPDPARVPAVAGSGRARTVASSLDLRGARVDEAIELLSRYLDDASLAGLDQVTVVHGLGTGALRDAVRASVADHPLVRDIRPGERGEGGDGATIVRL